MSNTAFDTEQQEIALGFVEESLEMLEEVEPLLIELEKRSDQSGDVDPEVVNTIFRLFHSLKGGAGFLGFDTVGKITHTAETLLDLFRKGALKFSSDHIDILMRTCDFIRKLLNKIEDTFEDSGFEYESSELVVELTVMIDQLSDNSEDKAAAKNNRNKKNEVQTADPKPAEREELCETKSKSKGEPLQAGEDMMLDLQSLISPEMVKQFVTEGEELLETAEEALLNMEKEPQNEEFISTAFRALHSFKGNAGYLAYSDLQKLSHQMESVLDLIREGEITGEGELLSFLLEALDVLQYGIAVVHKGEEPLIQGLSGWISLLNDYTLDMSNESGETAKEDNESVEEPETVRTQEEPDATETVDSKIEPPLAEQTKAAAEWDGKTERRKEEDRRKVRRPDQPERRASSHQTVRVDVEKLDSLLDLVGELVIAETMVAQNPDLKVLDISMDRFDKSVMQLTKISRDLQDIATSIRMIPLSGTFRRMIRLVRDLSQKSGKKVDLKLVGEETEVDKTVIEQINDPLVHIIRNSIDHGLETPEEREASGKPADGTVKLEAKYVGGEVWIAIDDDGRGLNRDKIIQKAIERGLVIGDGADLPDKEVWQLIFQPGFSTADKITDVSGRGVGMDVVKRNIEDIRGKVDVHSSTGKGSSIVLRIPLTLAIIDGMLIRVGNIRYTLPLINIKESLQPSEADVTKTPDGHEIVNIRGKFIPVIRLHKLFNIEPEREKLSEGIIIVLESQGDSVCLFVDEQLGQQQIVIKELSEYIGHVQCVSGCTILGDGDVSLIIDVAGMISMLQRAEKVAGDIPAGL